MDRPAESRVDHRSSSGHDESASEEIYTLCYRHSSMEPVKGDFCINLLGVKYEDLTVAQLRQKTEGHTITHLVLEGRLLPDIHSVAPELTHLSVRNAKIDTIESLSKLQELKELVLSWSTFKLSEVLNFSSWPSLTALYMDYCGLKSLPDSFSQLKKLEVLNLDGNKFTSSNSLSFISHLKSLTKLYLDDCGLEDLPDGFGALKNLKRLHLGYNEFKELPASIYKLSNLENLWIQGIKQLTQIDSAILNLNKLRYICCDGCTSLSAPPYGVRQQGIAAIKKYFTELAESVTPPTPGAKRQTEIEAQLYATGRGQETLPYSEMDDLQQKTSNDTSSQSQIFELHQQIKELTKIVAANHETMSSVCRELEREPHQRLERESEQDVIGMLQSQLNYIESSLPEDIAGKPTVVDSVKDDGMNDEEHGATDTEIKALKEEEKAAMAASERYLSSLLKPENMKPRHMPKPKIPEKLINKISSLCETNSSVENAVHIRSPHDPKKIYLLGVNVESMQEKLDRAKDEFPGFTVIARNSSSALLTDHLGWERKLIIASKLKEEQSWSEMHHRSVTCELFLRSDELNKDNRRKMGAMHVVVPAHLILRKNESKQYASAKINLNFLRQDIEKRSTEHRFIAEVQKVKTTFDLTHPPLLRYMHWRSGSDSNSSNIKTAKISEDKGEKPKMIYASNFYMSDIALLGMDDQSFQHVHGMSGTAGEPSEVQLFDIRDRGHLLQLIEHKHPIEVKGAKGYLTDAAVDRYQTGSRQDYYGLHLAFVLEDQELVPGDCGAIIYISTQSGKQPLGLFVGKLIKIGEETENKETNKSKAEKKAKGSEIYQAIILNKAMDDLMSAYPHYLGNIKYFLMSDTQNALQNATKLEKQADPRAFVYGFMFFVLACLLYINI